MSRWAPSAALSYSCLPNLRGRADAHKVLLGVQVCHPSPETQTQTRQGFFKNLFWCLFVCLFLCFSKIMTTGSTGFSFPAETETPHQQQSRDFHKVYWGVCMHNCSLPRSACRDQCDDVNLIRCSGGGGGDMNYSTMLLQQADSWRVLRASHRVVTSSFWRWKRPFYKEALASGSGCLMVGFFF